MIIFKVAVLHAVMTVARLMVCANFDWRTMSSLKSLIDILQIPMPETRS